MTRPEIKLYNSKQPLLNNFKQRLLGNSKISNLFYFVISVSLMATTSRSKIRSLPAKG
jgi:hypothetical protein